MDDGLKHHQIDWGPDGSKEYISTPGRQYPPPPLIVHSVELPFRMYNNATASRCPAIARRYYEQNHLSPSFPTEVSQQYLFYVTNTPFSLLFAMLVLALYCSAKSAKNAEKPFAIKRFRAFGPLKLVPFLMLSVVGKCVFYLWDGIKVIRCLKDLDICCLAKVDSEGSCCIRGALRLFFGQSIFLLVLCIAFDAFSIVVRRQRVKIRTYLVVGYGMPLFTAVVVYLRSMTGPTNLVKCWLRGENQPQKTMIWYLYYIPLLVVWLFSFIFIAAVGRQHQKFLKSFDSRQSSFSSPPPPSDANRIPSTGRRTTNSYYVNIVMAFLAVRIFSLIDTVFRTSFKTPKYSADARTMKNILFYTGTLHNFSSTLEGFALALVILSLRPLKQSPLYKKIGVFCDFCCFFWCIPSVYREKARSINADEMPSDVFETHTSDIDEYIYNSDLSSSMGSSLEMNGHDFSFADTLEGEADNSYRELK